jgi:uncharacterized membrane protein YjjP (DUF1212 family)
MEKQITVREATNRGNNMLMVGYMAITAAAIVERLIGEDDMVDQIDEAVIILLAIAGLVWYFSRRNRYQHSFAPLALFVATFVVQAGGLMAEISDPAAAGDDFGLAIAYAIGLIVSIVIYARSREKAAFTEQIPVENIDHPR